MGILSRDPNDPVHWNRAPYTYPGAQTSSYTPQPSVGAGQPLSQMQYHGPPQGSYAGAGRQSATGGSGLLASSIVPALIGMAGGYTGNRGLMGMAGLMGARQDKQRQQAQHQDLVAGIMGINDPVARAQAFTMNGMTEEANATLKQGAWADEQRKRQIDMASTVSAMERGDINTGLQYIKATQQAAGDFDAAEMRYNMYVANTEGKDFKSYTSADDTSLIMAALKMMDSSTVMQGELDAAASSGVLGDVKNLVNEVLSGDKVTMSVPVRQAWHEFVTTNINVLQAERHQQMQQYNALAGRYPELFRRNYTMPNTSKTNKPGDVPEDVIERHRRSLAQ